MKYALLAALLLPCSLFAADIEPFSATYELSKGSMVLGRVEMTLSIKGDRYDFQSESKTTGMAAMLSGDAISERSQGRLLPNGGLEPHSYSYRHTQGKNIKADTRISFTPGKQQARIERHKKEPKILDIAANTQDQLSAQLLLMRNSTRATLKFGILDGKKLHSYEYQAKGPAEAKTPAGTFKALHFQRQEPGKPQGYDIWLKKDANPIVVLLQQQEKPNEAVFSLKLSK